MKVLINETKEVINLDYVARVKFDPKHRAFVEPNGCISLHDYDVEGTEVIYIPVIWLYGQEFSADHEQIMCRYTGETAVKLFDIISKDAYAI